MKKVKYPELKSSLKTLAGELKVWKKNRKQEKRIELKFHLYEIEYEIAQRREEFRTKHIAYCLLNGRKYENIEKPATNNPPNWYAIERLLENYGQKTLCAS